jgi:hypothetical protein
MKKTILAAGFSALMTTTAMADGIGVSMSRFDDNFLTVLRNGIQAQADAAGLSVQIEDAQNDVAKQLVVNSGKPVEIEIVGLRAGEKVHEELFGDGETDSRPMHPLISHVPVPELDSSALPAQPLDARQTMIEIIAQ